MKHTVTQQSLSQGTRGLLIDVPGVDVTNIMVRFNSGYQFIDRSIYELPHVMEHLMSTSSRKYPEQNAFMIEATKNGAYMNAFTSSDTNAYVYECADFERDRILDLLEEQLVRPLFTPEALKAEIGNVREELTRLTTQHASVCSIRLNEKAYPDQSMDYEARIEQLDNITLEAMEEYYKKAFTASNARFYVSGAVSSAADDIVRRLEQLFAQLPTGEELTLNPSIGLDIPDAILTQRDIAQCYYQVSFFMGELMESQRTILSMLRLVLVGGIGSLIYGEARRRGLAYGVSIGTGMAPGNSEFNFNGYVTPKNAAELFEVMTRHLENVSEGQLTPKQLADAKQLSLGSIKRTHQTGSDMLGWYVGAYDRELKIVDFDKYQEDLNLVTLEDVAAMARKVIRSGARGMSLVGDITDKKAQGLKSIFNELK